ncbi:MAG TPA: helix-turn-helix transcriptional regulator [Verrucomicrobiae bacterium]
MNRNIAPDRRETVSYHRQSDESRHPTQNPKITGAMNRLRFLSNGEWDVWFHPLCSVRCPRYDLSQRRQATALVQFGCEAFAECAAGCQPKLVPVFRGVGKGTLRSSKIIRVDFHPRPQHALSAFSCLIRLNLILPENARQMSYAFLLSMPSILCWMQRLPLEVSESFALVVQKHRMDQGLSRAVLAEQSGLHQTYIGLLERGKRSPNLDTAQAIARALGVPLSRLIVESEKIQDRKA